MTDPQTQIVDQADATDIEHPTLGPAVAVYDDRGKTLRNLPLSAGMAVAGAVGLVLGIGDLPGGDRMWAVLITIAGAALLAYGLNELWSTLWRLRSPARLVVGKRGFGCSITPDPIKWDEVESVGFERVARGKPNAVMVKLADPAGFGRAHRLSLRARLMLKLNAGSLYLGRGTRVPADRILDLMSDSLSAYRRNSTPPAPRTTQRIRRKGPNSPNS